MLDWRTMKLYAILLAASVLTAAPLKVLIVDGQNNHKWMETTPILKRQLEASGRFRVDVATSPAMGANMSSFKPVFAAYDVVISNYNGDAWPRETREALSAFVRGGGGFVSYHAANNSFPEWKEYNEMIALGGWGQRKESAGPYVRYKNGQFVRDATTPGPGGHHGQRHPFQVTLRNQEHAITKGLPERWMPAQDELSDRMRGPAENMTILATAYSDPTTGGTGEHEPMLLVVKYGKGRVFHTMLGHDAEAMQCVGFTTTLLRGTEWAATGAVTIPIPRNFPTEDRLSLHE